MLYLQARAQSVGRILIGFYQLPDSAAQPIDFVVNPEGNELRSELRRVSTVCQTAACTVLCPQPTCPCDHAACTTRTCDIQATGQSHSSVHGFDNAQVVMVMAL